MNNVYIAFLSPNNKMGRFIRFFTGIKYSHVAISLDGSLKQMYSFARRKRRLPFAGGFIVEYPIHYFTSSGEVPLKVVSITLDDIQYTRLVSIIEDFSNRKEDLIYNTIDALSSALSHPILIKDCYTCISFCCYLLGLNRVYTIPELEKQLTDSIIYVGNYKEYVGKAEYIDPFFFEDLSIHRIVYLTFKHFGLLFKRLL